MSIQFGGLATGLDTSSIIDQLMNIERQPLTRLEADKTWLNNRLKAFTELDTRLKAFSDSIKDLNYRDTLLKRSTTLGSEEFFTASASRDAMPGASYEVEVVSLARVQKSVSGGVASSSAPLFGTGSLSLTVGGDTHTIDIGEGENSLTGVMEAINAADVGVRAAIINDGTVNPDGSSTPFRMVLTGETVAKEFSLDASGLTGGASLDLGTPVQQATRAHVRVDNIDIYSDTNTLTEAIPGMTLDLRKAEAGTTTSLAVNVDKAAIKEAIEEFATGYNKVVSFITSQSVIDGEGGGVLGGDSGINAIKRRLQTMLTQPLANSGVFTALSQLGFETQKDGTLQVNEKTLGAAIDENLDSVVSLLAGEDGVEGVATRFKNYLFDLTSSATGMLQGRRESINSNLKRIDTKIDASQARLEQRQKTLEAQFSAMETLVSNLNAQSSYLTQQMTALTNMMSGSKR